jgi:DNA-binding XRE family transcriptional regulator
MEVNVMVKLCNAIRIKREALGYTQAQFANLVGCTDSTICNFENGKEISESIMKCIKYTIKDEEHKLTGNELAAYKLRVATEMAIQEPDDNTRQDKLRTVLYSALKWSDIIAQKSRGFIEY